MLTRLAGRWSRCTTRLLHRASSGAAVSGELSRMSPPGTGGYQESPMIGPAATRSRLAAARPHLPITPPTGGTSAYDSIARVVIRRVIGPATTAQSRQSFVLNGVRLYGDHRGGHWKLESAAAAAMWRRPRTIQNELTASNWISRTGLASSSTTRHGYSTKVKKVKLKGYSSYKERFRLLADGSFVRHKAGKRHNAHSKSMKQRRQLRRPALVAAGHATPLRKLAFSK